MSWNKFKQVLLPNKLKSKVKLTQINKLFKMHSKHYKIPKLQMKEQNKILKNILLVLKLLNFNYHKSNKVKFKLDNQLLIPKQN